jgi:succinoglycan biosynthesis protein ExoA
VSARDGDRADADAPASRPGAWPAHDDELPPLSRWPAVSVVIPARDSAGTLERAVDSALAQRFDGSIEVVVAAAPSDDRTEEVAMRLTHDRDRVRYLPNLDGSTPAGLNVAIGAARGDVIVRLDAHAQLPPGYIATALDVLRETGAGNVGGMQVPVGEGAVEEAVAVAMRSTFGSGGARYRVGGEAGDVETVYLGVFRSEALEVVGGFDESLARNQDYEMNHRLREAGFRVYFDPALRVRYRPRGSLKELWQQYFDYGAWKRLVLRMHPGSLQVRQLAPPALAVGLVLALLGSLLLRSPLPLLGLLVVYLVALTAGAASAAREEVEVPDEAGSPDRPGWSAVPLVVLALATMHLAWGAGFLIGRRSPGGDHAEGGPPDGDAPVGEGPSDGDGPAGGRSSGRR